MFDMLKSVWVQLKKKLTVPAAAFGVIGVSTTLACCYGPAPDYPVEDVESLGACESMLRECAQVHGLWADECATGSMKTCNSTISRRATQAFNKSTATQDYMEYVNGLLDNKEITEAAALEAALMPWMNCTITGVTPAASCTNPRLKDVQTVLSGNTFKDKSVRLIAAKYMVESDREALRARGYELAAAAIADDVSVDASVANVLARLAEDTSAYAMLAGIKSFGAAVVANYSRVKAASDASQPLDAAKANVKALDAIAKDAQTKFSFAEVQDAASALVDQIAALELE